MFPKLAKSEVALTWIGHASFLVQFPDLNVLIDPNFANWLFLLKRLKHAGLSIRDLPPIDLVLLTHAHFDHFHKPSLRRIPSPKIGVMPWGLGDLARGLGFSRIVELQWWESLGGVLNVGDLAAHTSDWVGTIHMDYRAVRLHEIPPNGQGLAALLALGILENFDIASHKVDSAISVHLQIEVAGKQAA